jgi:hypothetical protein
MGCGQGRKYGANTHEEQFSPALTMSVAWLRRRQPSHVPACRNHLFIENSSRFNNPAIDRLYFHESRDWESFSDLLFWRT